MKEAWREFWTAGRNRVIFFALAGLSLTLIVFHSFENPDMRGVPAPIDVGSASAPLESLRQVSSGTGAAKSIRDPFALPDALRAAARQENKPQQNEAHDALKKQRKKAETSPILSAVPRDVAQLKLTGVISAADKKLAILTFGSEHKQCEVNECIGPYRVAEIQSETVILAGPSGTFALTVGR